jgi:creatinine amidohydrolase/Fe(II)-dependent formamide hydrolase-like protein
LVAQDVALSAIAAGFKNVILMGEHGGGQEALKETAARLDAQWSSRGIHVYYVGYKEVDRRIAEYCKAHGLVVGEHAGVPDTSRLMFIDSQGAWVRRDKIAPGGEWSKTGVDGDPTQASAELGERFIAMCVQGWANEIRRLVNKGK